MAEPTRRLVRVVETTSSGTGTSTQLIINVKTAHGAVGDGATDDTVAIQAAVDSVRGRDDTGIGGGTVYFPEGTYKVTSAIDLVQGVTFMGAGEWATKIDGSSVDIIVFDSYYVTKAQNYIRIENMQIQGKASGTNPVVRIRNSSHCSMRNVTLFNGDMNLLVDAAGYFIAENCDFNGSGATKVVHCGSGIHKSFRNCRIIGANDSGIGFLFDDTAPSAAAGDVYFLDNCEISQMTGFGVHILNYGQGEIHRCDVSAFNDSDSNFGGFKIEDSSKCRIINCWVEDGDAGSSEVIGYHLDGTVTDVISCEASFTAGTNKHGIKIESTTCFVSGGNYNVGTADTISACVWLLTATSSHLVGVRTANGIYGFIEQTSATRNTLVGCTTSGSTTNFTLSGLSRAIACWDGNNTYDHGVSSHGDTAYADDATPSIGGKTVLIITDTGANTITDFSDKDANHRFTCIFKSANTTIDFTGGNLKGNNGVDWVAASGDSMECIVGESGTTVYCTPSTNVAATFIAFVADDATPSVAVGDGKHFKTANANPTTVTDFNDGIAGQEIWVYIADANTTIDLTGTNLDGNGGADFTAAVGDMLHAISYDGTNWKVLIINIA